MRHGRTAGPGAEHDEDAFSVLDGLRPKRAALRLSDALGLFRLADRASGGLLPVLTYHHVIDDDEAREAAPLPDSLVASVFDRQVRHLVSRYHVVTGAELLRFARGELELPSKSVLITFDDGYRNNFQHAFRILNRYGATAIFFVTSEFVGHPDNRLWFERFDRVVDASSTMDLEAWVARHRLEPGLRGPEALRLWFKRLGRDARDELLGDMERCLAPSRARREATAPMSWDHVRELARQGMTIGAHTASHQILSAATPEEASAEVHESRARIEHETGLPCWCFSYPNGTIGDFRSVDVDSVRRAGYACAFTQIAGFVTPRSDMLRLPRISIPSTRDFEVFLSRVTGLHYAVERVTSGIGRWRASHVR